MSLDFNSHFRDNSDCTAMVCSTCENHQCVDPECCNDADCLNTQFCEDNKCKDGCNEDSDCSMNGECATCNMNSHQCSDPECCNDSNCTPEFLECSVCQADQTCTNPECCKDSDCITNEKPVCDTDNNVCLECLKDSDCPDDKPICDTDNNVCIEGCKVDENCVGYNEKCNGDYTADGASCFYCDLTSDVGNCAPGCVDNGNCDGTDVCNGQHRCTEQGGANNLANITFTTESCSGCSSNAIEGGLKLTLKGEQSTSGPTSCSTEGLDHTNKIDYAAKTDAVFKGEEDKDILDNCYLVSLEITYCKCLYSHIQRFF